MPQLTASGGLVPYSLREWLDALEGAFRGALGEDLDVSSESPIGQITGVLALILAQSDEIIAGRERGFSVEQSYGFQIEDLASLVRITRNPATATTVDVMFVGEANTVVPANTRVNTTDGDTFYLISALTIPAAGNIIGGMRAAELGAVPAPAGSLTHIIDRIAGLSRVTNGLDGVVGQPVESDGDLRIRFRNRIARNNRGFAESIGIAIREVSGVTQVRIANNNNTAAVTKQGVSIGAHSVLIAVEGGADSDVAAAIALRLPLGTPTTGTTSVTLRGDIQGTYQFSRVVDIPVQIVVNILARPSFPSDGPDTMRTFLGYFFGYLGIGEGLDIPDIYEPLRGVRGHVVQSIYVDRVAGYSLTGTGTVGTLAAIQALANDAFTMTVNGTAITVSGMDFSAITTIEDAAGVLQTALRANGGDLSTVTVTTEGTGDSVTAFILTLLATSSGIPTVIGSVGTGTVAAPLGLDSGDIVGGITEDDLLFNERITLSVDDIIIMVNLP